MLENFKSCQLWISTNPNLDLLFRWLETPKCFFEKWWWTPWDRIRKKTHPTKTNPRKTPKNHLFPHPLGLVQFTYELTLKINHVGKIFQGGVKSVKSVQVDSMYPPVNELGNGNPPFSNQEYIFTWWISIAMLIYWRVPGNSLQVLCSIALSLLSIKGLLRSGKTEFLEGEFSNRQHRHPDN